jgi:hypothetical protein
MIVSLRYNIEAVLLEAGYGTNDDSGFFRQLTHREIRRYNRSISSSVKRRACPTWRFHAIPLSDFTFNLHLDFGKGMGHKFTNEHILLIQESDRINEL